MRIVDRNISRKLDRALVNEAWNSKIQQSNAEFLAPGVSDHTPVVVKIGEEIKRRKTPFKVF